LLKTFAVIIRSPNQPQPVLNAITRTAARLSQADNAHFRLLRDGANHVASSNNYASVTLQRLVPMPTSALVLELSLGTAARQSIGFAHPHPLERQTPLGPHQHRRHRQWPRVRHRQANPRHLWWPHLGGARACRWSPPSVLSFAGWRREQAHSGHRGPGRPPRRAARPDKDLGQ